MYDVSALDQASCVTNKITDLKIPAFQVLGTGQIVAVFGFLLVTETNGSVLKTTLRVSEVTGTLEVKDPAFV